MNASHTRSRTESSSPFADIAKIMALIPHRHPFLLIDRVLAVESGKYAAGLKAVSATEPCFQWCHSGAPTLLPGSLIIESMAQMAAVLAAVTFRSTAVDKIIYLLNISGARFRHPVEIGDLMHVEVTLKHGRGDTWRLYGRASTSGVLNAEATLMGAIVERRDNQSNRSTREHVLPMNSSIASHQPA